MSLANLRLAYTLHCLDAESKGYSPITSFSRYVRLVAHAKAGLTC
jgi:hypothetical protein